MALNTRFNRKPLRRMAAALALAALLAVVAVGTFGSSTSANVLGSMAAPPLPGAQGPAAGSNDGFDQLTTGQQGLSYSTLTHMGRVHPPSAGQTKPDTSWHNPFSPNLAITWGADHNTSSVSAGEPAVGIHPNNPLYALVSGNVTIDNTTDGGTTWAHRNPPNASGYGDVVNAWLEPAGANALEVALNPASDGANYTCARTSDFGVTWTTDAACGTSLSTSFFDDREYLWVDRNASSPFYGHVYMTGALFDAAGSGSFNTVTLRRSSDNGATWQPPSTAPNALVPGNEFATGAAHNEFPSLGISANGTVGYAWHRGLCCGGSPTVGTNNKVMFARSTDGGVTFPFSTTVVTVPSNQAIPFNSTSPLNVRWSDMPNIAADPTTNGVFYAVWTQYRTAATPASAAVYLSKTTDNGATWSTPVIPYNNANGNIFQGWGWVKVTADHAVHVTFLSGTTSNTAVAQFYTQSTDSGATWTAPFQLSSSTFGAFSVTTDYEANDVTLAAGAGSIIAGWAQSAHFARIGTFGQGAPSPTGTGTPPTATRTITPTGPSPTPTCSALAAWHAGPDFPSTMARAVGAWFPTNNRFYVVGGRSTDTAGSELTHPYEYNPATNTWTAKTATWPDANTNNMVGGVLTGPSGPRIYAVGGSPCCGGTFATDRVLVYDPAADSVTTLTTDPWPGTSAQTTLPGGAAVFNNKLYVLGGFVLAAGPMTSQIWEFDPNRAAGARWALKTATLPTPLGYIPAATIGSFIYTLGGSTYTTTIEDTAHTYRYDPAADTISDAAIAELPNATGETNAVVWNGKIWVMGGGRTSPNPSNGVQVWDPGTNTWSAGPAFTTARRNFPVAANPGVGVYLVGGYTPSAPDASMEIFASSGGCTTSTPTATSTSGSVITNTPTSTRTNTPGGATSTRTATVTPCAITFTDVHSTDFFYQGVVWLYCRGAISGYGDNTFRPFNNTTRGQMVKIVTLAYGIPTYTPTNPTFNDVPTTDPFYSYIETAAHNNIVSGYNCGGPGEPCPGVYFRPVALVTRGQLSKIVVVAAGWGLLNPVNGTFNDVARNSAFYTYIETAYCHQVISGYTCGGPGEPCPGLYFRPGNNATRGQIAKIVYNAISNLPCTTNGQDATSYTGK